MSANTAPIPGLDTAAGAGTTIVDFEPGTTPRDTTARIPAFIGLAREHGGRYAENLAGMSIPDALAAAGLNFTVIKIPFGGDVAVRGHDVRVDGPSKLVMTVATYPHPGPDGVPAGLGVVGQGYGVVQPAAAGEFAQQVLDESGATVVAVCAYGDPQGSRMLLALQLPGGLLIGGEDLHNMFLVVGNSFNSETSLWGCAAPLRVECVNQIAGTFGRHANRFKIPHRVAVDERVDEVRDTLRITGTFAQRYAEAAERLLSTPMDGGEVFEFARKLMPTPADVKTANGATAWDLRRLRLAELIRSGERNTVGRGTRYAALQGVTEFADHTLPANTARTRYTRIVSGTGETEQLKRRATSLLLAGI